MWKNNHAKQAMKDKNRQNSETIRKPLVFPRVFLFFFCFCVLFSCYFCFCNLLCLVCSCFWFKRKACSNQPKWSKSRLAPDAMDCNAWNGMLYAWSQPHCHIMMFSVISIVNDFILEVPLIVNLYIFGILLLPWLALRERPKNKKKEDC